MSETPLSPPAWTEPDIGQIAITVSNVAEAKLFYRDVMGPKFLFDAGPNLTFLQAGAVRIMLSTSQGHGEPGKNSTLYFRVTDIVRVHATIVARGATDERAAPMPDHDLWMGFVRDPDGNLAGLMEEVRPPVRR
ncbi:MAG: VOC family protein [Candidatus Synoicihabitans palmerolidicus]|nr:VOC family protein [Candidatus Synoicihabitans palmerolidicus]